MKQALFLDNEELVHSLIARGFYDANNILLMEEHRELRARFIRVRKIIVTLLAFKKRQIASMLHLDRFLLRKLGVCVLHAHEAESVSTCTRNRRTVHEVWLPN